ncbi:MAG: hypothetical protein ABGZ24_18950, partial [Fuerstiella sp.]
SGRNSDSGLTRFDMAGVIATTVTIRRERQAERHVGYSQSLSFPEGSLSRSRVARIGDTAAGP